MTDIAGKGFLLSYTHNLKVVGSNPTPATNVINTLAALVGGFFFVYSQNIRKLVWSWCGAGAVVQFCHVRKKR